MATIRWMQTKDLDFVTSIELKNNEFYSTRDDIINLLRRKSVVGIVALEEEEIIGFIIYELMNRRIQMLDMGVHQDYHKKGIGSFMINELKDNLSPKKRTKISVEVRETNLGFQLFLQKNNFLAIEVLKDYFPDTNEDAFVMSYILPAQK